MNGSNFKRHLVWVLVFLVMGFLSYLGTYFTYTGLAKGTFLIDALILALIYIFGRKIGSFYFLIGASIGFLYVNKISYFLLPYFPKMSFETLSISNLKILSATETLFFFLHSLNYKEILDSWSTKKILNYLTRNAFIVPVIICLVFLSLNNNRNPVDSLLEPPYNPLNVLVYAAMIGLKSMGVNVSLWITSSFSTIFISMFTLRNPLDSNFSKLDTTNIIVSRWYKLLFAILLVLSGLFYYFNYIWFTFIFIVFSFSLMFLFFVIGRELLFRAIRQISGDNIIFTWMIIIGLFTFVPMMIGIIITVGFLQVYLNIWNNQDNQNPYLE